MRAQEAGESKRSSPLFLAGRGLRGRRSQALGRLRGRRGATIVLVAAGLVALLGAAALSIDIGQMVVAAQRAQDVADAAALAAGAYLKTPDVAISTALQYVGANNQPHQGFPIVCRFIPFSPDSDIVYYPMGSYVPGYGWLGLYARALRVRTHITVPFSFARVLGLTSTYITRQAIVIRAPVGGTPIAPMWVSHPTEYQYGQYQNLLMADGPHYAGIPGNFGWLALPPEVSASWITVLSGAPLSDDDVEALFRDIGDLVYGYPGLSVGQWVRGLEDRLARAESNPRWADDTFDNFEPDNPRILIVPLVSYVSGTGSGATFRIEKFGAFWLENINNTGNPKSIGGRFIRYTLPGAGINPLADDTGLFSFRLAG